MFRTTMLAVLLTACGGTETTTPGTETETTEQAGTSEEVEEAAEIAVAIRANPDEYEVILTRHDTTAAEFERLLYRIAADPQKSAAYETALQ